MEKSSFFNAVETSPGIYDRNYFAEDMAEFFNSLVTNGVFPGLSTNLQVISNNDMTVILKAGKAWINGYVYILDADMILTIDTADGVLNRIDRIVIQFNTVGRAINAVVVKGTLASTPYADDLYRDADLYELGVADIYITNGATIISQVNITDMRFNNNFCGVVNSLITADTTTLFAQYEDAFSTWFANIQDVLDENTEANLLTKIDDNKILLDSHLEDNSKQIPHIGTTSNSGNTYTVTTTESITTNQKFTIKINAASTGVATLTVSTIGSAKGIKKAGGHDAILKIGVYSFFYDGSNFQLLGEGGEYGTALNTDVMVGTTIGTEDGLVDGSIIDRGTVNYTPSTVNQAVLGGKVSGLGMVYGSANLASKNIKKGINLFDTLGTLVENPITSFIEDNNGDFGYGDGTLICDHQESVYMMGNGGYVKRKEVIVKYGGVISVRVSIKTSNSAWDAYARVHINDVPMGDELMTGSESWESWRQHFTVNAGDRIQLFLDNEGGGYTYNSTFNITIGNPVPSYTEIIL